jgi:hypothetical protein
LFVNFDGKLPRNSPVNHLPFYDEEFLKEIIKEEKLTAAPRIGGVVSGATVFQAWLKKCAVNIPVDTTLVLDSWTMMQQQLDTMLQATPKQNDKGEIDGFDFWGRKAIFSETILAYLKNIPATNTVVLFHETKALNADGVATGKWNPLMSGSIKDKLAANFTHWIRQTAEENKTTKLTEYLWQIKPNNECNCNCPEPHLLNQPGLIKVKATYDSLIK